MPEREVESFENRDHEFLVFLCFDMRCCRNKAIHAITHLSILIFLITKASKSKIVFTQKEYFIPNETSGVESCLIALAYS